MNLSDLKKKKVMSLVWTLNYFLKDCSWQLYTDTLQTKDHFIELTKAKSNSSSNVGLLCSQGNNRICKEKNCSGIGNSHNVKKASWCFPSSKCQLYSCAPSCNTFQDRSKNGAQDVFKSFMQLKPPTANAQLLVRVLLYYWTVCWSVMWCDH